MRSPCLLSAAKIEMTAERFGELLRRPKLLSGQNATELEELIARFPWCGPLRRLRYGKALLDGDEAHVALWRDRASPFLRSGSTITQAEELAGANPARANQHFGFEDAATSPAVIELPAPLEWDLSVVATSVDVVEHFLQQNGHITEDVRARPTPITAFESYQAHRRDERKPAFGDLLGYSKEASKPKKRKKRRPKKESAVDHPEIASETLAVLLARQGHVKRAVRMYELLALRDPNKKATFAARIAQLQQQEPQ